MLLWNRAPCFPPEPGEDHNVGGAWWPGPFFPRVKTPERLFFQAQKRCSFVKAKTTSHILSASRPGRHTIQTLLNTPAHWATRRPTRSTSLTSRAPVVTTAQSPTPQPPFFRKAQMGRHKWERHFSWFTGLFCSYLFHRLFYLNESSKWIQVHKPPKVPSPSVPSPFVFFQLSPRPVLVVMTPRPLATNPRSCRILRSWIGGRLVRTLAGYGYRPNTIRIPDLHLGCNKYTILNWLDRPNRCCSYSTWRTKYRTDGKQHLRHSPSHRFVRCTKVLSLWGRLRATGPSL